MVLGNGGKTDFRLDVCYGARSLKDKFPELYAMCTEQNIKVSDAAARSWSLSFRRWLNVTNQTQLRCLRDILLSLDFPSELSERHPEMDLGEKRLILCEFNVQTTELQYME